MNASEGDELVFVAHGAEFALKPGNGGVVKVFLPVERRRTVVSQHLAGVLGMHRLGKFFGKVQIRRAGFAPHQVRIVCIGDRAGNGLVHAFACFIKALCGALASQEGFVVVVVVAGQQVGGLGIGSGYHQRWHATDIGRHARGDELLASLGRGHQHLAAHMTTFFDRGELVFPVHACSARADHGLHQLERVEYATKTGLGIGDDGGKVVDVALVAGINALGMLNFIRPAKGVVDALHHLGNRIHRVQRLVGVHGCIGIVVCGHLPARQVNSLDPSLDLLHRLPASQGA